MLRSSPLLLLGGVAGYFAARRLMDDASIIEALPADARGYALIARERLLRARASVGRLLAAIEDERATAERSLIDSYLTSSGRVHSDVLTGPPPEAMPQPPPFPR